VRTTRNPPGKGQRLLGREEEEEKGQKRQEIKVQKEVKVQIIQEVERVGRQVERCSFL